MVTGLAEFGGGAEDVLAGAMLIAGSEDGAAGGTDCGFGGSCGLLLLGWKLIAGIACGSGFTSGVTFTGSVGAVGDTVGTS